MLSLISIIWFNTKGKVFKKKKKTFFLNIYTSNVQVYNVGYKCLICDLRFSNKMENINIFLIHILGLDVCLLIIFVPYSKLNIKCVIKIKFIL